MDINKITKEDIVAWFKQQEETCYKCPFNKECDTLMDTYEGPKLCDIIAPREDGTEEI